MTIESHRFTFTPSVVNLVLFVADGSLQPTKIKALIIGTISKESLGVRRNIYITLIF